MKIINLPKDWKISASICYTKSSNYYRVEVLTEDEKKKILDEDNLVLERAANNFNSFSNINPKVLIDDKKLLTKEVNKSLRILSKEVLPINEKSLILEKVSGKFKVINPNGEIRTEELSKVQIVRANNLVKSDGINSNLNEYKFILNGLNPIYKENEDAPKFFVEKAFELKQLVSYKSKLNNEFQTNKNFDAFTDNLFQREIIVVMDFEPDGSNTFFSNTTTDWLEEKNFRVIKFNDMGTFINYIDSNQVDLIWVICSQLSTNTSLDSKFVNSIVNKNNQGTPLLLWANNEPYTYQINLILVAILGDNTQLIGNYTGQKIIVETDNLTKGTFDKNHKVASGFKRLNEGLTICFPNQITSRMKIFSYNTNPNEMQPQAFEIIPKVYEGKIWVDTGFTKLNQDYGNPDDVKRYVTNVSRYLIDK